MTDIPSTSDFKNIAVGYSTNPNDTFSLKADAYTDDKWFNIDQKKIIAKVGHW